MVANPITIVRSLCDRELIPTALKASAVVGTLLLCINHGSSIVRGTMTRDRWLAAGFTYLVPYCVSIHGQYMSRRRWQREQLKGDHTAERDIGYVHHRRE